MDRFRKIMWGFFGSLAGGAPPAPTGDLLLINATDQTLINATDKLEAA